MPSAHHFLGDVTGVERRAAGAELRAGTPRVRVEAVADGTFQVRLSPDGTPFTDPPFSYAVLPEALSGDVRAEVVEDQETVRVRHGGFAAVVERAPLRVRFEDEAGHAFAEDDFGMCWHGDRVRVYKRREDGEFFYGLGEKAAPLNRTSRSFVNWNTDFPYYKSWHDPLYKTFPFYIGSKKCADGVRRAYGVFFDNSFRSTFDFSAEARGRVAFGADGGALTYYVFMGPDVADVLRRYTDLTGRAPLPPLWALGYQQCRWSYYPASQVRNLVREFRDRSIPLDVLYLDIHYMDEYRVFTWDPERFPEPGPLLEELRAQGVKVVLIIDPGVKVDEGYHVYEEGLERDAFVKYPDGSVYTGAVWPGDCHFPDFTKPDTRAWFGDYYRGLLDEGVAGFWADMNEPSNFRFRTLPEIAVHDFEGRGGTHLEAHNVYGLLMARATYEGCRRHAPDRRPLVVTRSAYAGIQRYSAAWTGDNVSDWESLRLVLPMLLSLGLSGVPFSGSDVGGFAGTPSPELFARWIQLGAFSPFFRTHSEFESPLQEPWSFGPRVEAIAARYIELRYRLLPLLYTLFFEHTRTGLPLLRPLFLHYPQDEHALGVEDQFLVGDGLVVAPVLSEGAHTRQVYLPEGRWYDFWTGEEVEGGTEVLVEAALEELPVFAAAGRVVPLAPVRQYVGEREVDALELRFFRGSGTSQLYEDDGTSQAYTEGDFRLTTFTAEDDSATCTLRRETEGPYRSPLRRFVLRLPGTLPPQAVQVDGRALRVRELEDPEAETPTGEAAYEPLTQMLTVPLPGDFGILDVQF